MNTEKVYDVTITRTTTTQVFATSKEQALQYVSEMYENGDSCSELNDAIYSVELGEYKED